MAGLRMVAIHSKGTSTLAPYSEAAAENLTSAHGVTADINAD